MLTKDKLILPSVTPNYRDRAKEQIATAIKNQKDWRAKYLLDFPEMDNTKGSNKLNNFLHRPETWDTDVYRSLCITLNLEQLSTEKV